MCSMKASLRIYTQSGQELGAKGSHEAFEIKACAPGHRCLHVQPCSQDPNTSFRVTSPYRVLYGLCSPSQRGGEAFKGDDRQPRPGMYS